MDARLWIDALFAGFCDTLAGPLRDEARRLPHTLGLAADPRTPWSALFRHEITFAAPVLVSDAMPAVSSENVRRALAVHLFAMIVALGVDRAEDGQIARTSGLDRVLAAARAARDRHVRELAAAGSDPWIETEATDRETLAHIRSERALLGQGRVAERPTYEALARGKQYPGITGALALAVSAGIDARRRRALAEALMTSFVAMQIHDDVIDWEGDLEGGGAWVVALARRENEPLPIVLEGGGGLREHVHRSGILAWLLGRAAQLHRASARRARALGALRLAAWAGERAAAMRALAHREARHAGYVNRANALRHWAWKVLP